MARNTENHTRGAKLFLERVGITAVARGARRTESSSFGISTQKRRTSDERPRVFRAALLRLLVHVLRISSALCDHGGKYGLVLQRAVQRLGIDNLQLQPVRTDKERGRVMVKVTCQLTDYSEPAKPSIKVHNHWNYSSLVELEINNECFTVSGTDLIEAVKNCMNTNK